MLRIVRILTLMTITCLCLCSCYHIPVQQGNIINSLSADKIHKGMSRNQVVKVLGPPILINLFNKDMLAYVYTLQPARGAYQQRKLLIHFKGGRVSSLTTHDENAPNLPTPPA